MSSLNQKTDKVVEVFAGAIERASQNQMRNQYPPMDAGNYDISQDGVAYQEVEHVQEKPVPQPQEPPKRVTGQPLIEVSHIPEGGEKKAPKKEEKE